MNSEQIKALEALKKQKEIQAAENWNAAAEQYAKLAEQRKQADTEADAAFRAKFAYAYAKDEDSIQ